MERTSQYFDMTHVIAALSYFPVPLSWNKNTYRSYSGLLSSYSELKHDTHHSYSELLPSCSELKQDKHRSCCELLPSILSWHRIQIVATLNYFPVTLSWNITHIVVTLSYFRATLSWNITLIVAALSGFLELQAIILVIASLTQFLSPLSWKHFDGLIWDIKYKLVTNSISSNSQKFKWIS